MTVARFPLPDVGEGLTEAEIVSWRVAPGDRVELNQVICEIETAKSLVELPSPFAGTVVELLAAEGDTVEVGATIIAVDSDDAPEAPAEPSPADDAASTATDAAATVAEEDEGSGAVLVGYGTTGQVESRRHRLAGRTALFYDALLREFREGGVTPVAGVVLALRLIEPSKAIGSGAPGLILCGGRPVGRRALLMACGGPIPRRAPRGLRLRRGGSGSVRGEHLLHLQEGERQEKCQQEAQASGDQEQPARVSAGIVGEVQARRCHLQVGERNRAVFRAGKQLQCFACLLALRVGFETGFEYPPRFLMALLSCQQLAEGAQRRRIPRKELDGAAERGFGEGEVIARRVGAPQMKVRLATVRVHGRGELEQLDRLLGLPAFEGLDCEGEVATSRRGR